MCFSLPGLRSSLRLEGESIRSRASAASKVLSERWILAPWTEASTETKQWILNFREVRILTTYTHTLGTTDNILNIQHICPHFIHAEPEIGKTSIADSATFSSECYLTSYVGSNVHSQEASQNTCCWCQSMVRNRRCRYKRAWPCLAISWRQLARCGPERLSLGCQCNQSMSYTHRTQTHCGDPADHRAVIWPQQSVRS